MKKVYALCVFSIFAVPFLNAQSPTWADDVAQVIYGNCSGCHHAGGIGPFELMTYQDAVDNAIDIQTQVTAKKMPPWLPNANYVHFQNERILDQSEIDLINDWINDGAPSGNLANAPAPPVFSSGSQMTSIDETLSLPTWTVTSDVDQYRSYVIQTNHSTDLYINQIEYLPSNGSIVHHIVIWMDPTNQSYNKDLNDPLPGFQSNGTSAPSFAANFVSAWTPGAAIFKLPINMGIKLPAGGDYVVELHYAPGSLNETDSTTINISYTEYPTIREVYNDALLEHFSGLTDGPLYIPANTVQTFHEEFELNGFNASAVAVFPHMHLIGSSIKSFALNGNGDTTRLLDIPRWDFHWQGYYNYQKLIPIFNGSTFYAEASFDNTTNNPFNPNDPPIDVQAGEQTTDEMMIVFYAWTFYQAGDENVILDSTLVSTQDIFSDAIVNLEIYPNPASDAAAVGLNLKTSSAVKLELYNAAGILMEQQDYSTVAAGFTTTPLSVEELPAGIYLVKVSTDDGYAIRKMIKQ